MEAPQVDVTMVARGERVTIRTISPDDREMESEFVRSLSNQSRYYRFHSALRELNPQLLERFVNVSFPDNMALVATVGAQDEQQIGVARYAMTSPEGTEAEVAVVVSDEWHGHGIGTRLLVELRDVAVAAGVQKLVMTVLTQNRRMLSLAHRLGFVCHTATDDYISRTLGKAIGASGGW